jgi:hypothetical protein
VYYPIELCTGEANSWCFWYRLTALGINILENIPEQSEGPHGEFYAKNYTLRRHISSSTGDTPRIVIPDLSAVFFQLFNGRERWRLVHVGALDFFLTIQ